MDLKNYIEEAVSGHRRPGTREGRVNIDSELTVSEFAKELEKRGYARVPLGGLTTSTPVYMVTQNQKCYMIHEVRDYTWISGPDSTKYTVCVSDGNNWCGQLFFTRDGNLAARMSFLFTGWNKSSKRFLRHTEGDKANDEMTTLI